MKQPHEGHAVAALDGFRKNRPEQFVAIVESAQEGLLPLAKASMDAGDNETGMLAMIVHAMKPKRRAAVMRLLGVTRSAGSSGPPVQE